MRGQTRSAAGGRVLAGLFVLGFALLFLSGCGGRRLAAGGTPFPAEKPVFLDGKGREAADLPGAPEPFRLVLLDFPWCPACSGVWEAVRSAAGTLPPGTLHLYRILFDFERVFVAGGTAEVPPLFPTPPRLPPLLDREGGTVPVTTLTAIPGRFREQFRVGQVPVLLLLDRTGTVTARWVGSSPSLSASIVAEVTGKSDAPLPPET